jgi:hypothetical protein
MYNDMDPSPPAVAARMVELALDNIEFPDGYCLACEPSCGEGALARAVIKGLTAKMEDDWELHCIEKNPEIMKQAYAAIPPKNVYFRTRDSVEYFASHGPYYDLIVMNPPASGTLYQDHIRAAYSVLMSGGRLVALVPMSVLFVDSVANDEFTVWSSGKARHSEVASVEAADGNQSQALIWVYEKENQHVH